MTNPRIKNREKNYSLTNRIINKTKEEFKTELFNYAKTNFSDNIEDFSDASLGGMLLDFAAVIGESLSFYVEQQVNELDYETAFSDESIINHLRKAGVKSNNPSPASVYVDFYIEVDKTDGIIQSDLLPVIKKETSLNSSEGIRFILEEDLDFNESYELFDDFETSVVLKKTGLCTSGEVIEETFLFPENPNGEFFTYTLSNENVSSIISVRDDLQNEYYEVEFLSQDTVYTKTINSRESFFTITPAVFRFVREENFNSNFTTLRFGNGSGRTQEEGIFTDPEDIILPMLGRDYQPNLSLDPKNLINSDSLGVSPANKQLTFKYKFGGGEDHNVNARSINEVENLIITFPNTEDQANILFISESVDVLNEKPAIGGTEGLDFEDLRALIPLTMKTQSRIVNHEDLLSRIYSMPSNFGRIHKAAVLENPYTKSSKDMFVICKDSSGFYSPPNDAIKINLSNYLNEYRLIGDALNIIDAPIYNFSINIKVSIQEGFIQDNVINTISSNIINQMRFETLQIGQGINVNDIVSIVLNVPGVISIHSSFKKIIKSKSDIDNVSGLLVYNKNIFSSYENYENGIIYPPRGGIFEFKYLNDDITVITS